VDAIGELGPAFGNVDLGRGRKVQVEFVSANPVGPLHVGNGRGLALGDTLARVLGAAGYEVQREYLVNDAGTQTATFAATLYARYEQLFGREVDIPEGGYPGEYMIDVARQLKERCGDSLLRAEGDPYPPEVHDLGVEIMLGIIKRDLSAIGVQYDNWYSERSLYKSGTYDKTMALLRERGYVAEREGAIWLSSSALGEEKDNVLVRSTGAPTYFASDIAYHYDKFLIRGFDSVINIWGADHQGHVPRMKAAISALGVDPDRLTIIIYQLVTLKRGEELVKLSKRAGDIVTLREVVDEVGADAVRFNFVSRAADSHMDFDIELAKRQSAENPVYYVQYAHARIAGILTQAQERIADFSAGDVSLLTHEAELALIRRMLRLPELVETTADPRASPAPLLRHGPGDGIPRLLREVPRTHRRRSALQVAAQARLGRQADARAGARSNGHERPGAHVGPVAGLPASTSGKTAAEVARAASQAAGGISAERFRTLNAGNPIERVVRPKLRYGD
jgi:arginyl-tRNA synthetase